MKTLKEFSLLVRVPLTYTSDLAKAVNPEWDRVLEQWKQSNVYVLSFAFPGESHVIIGTDLKVTKEPVLSGQLRAVSNLVLRAETIEDAIVLARQCPVLAHGGSVEVKEIPRGVTLPVS